MELPNGLTEIMTSVVTEVYGTSPSDFERLMIAEAFNAVKWQSALGLVVMHEMSLEEKRDYLRDVLCDPGLRRLVEDKEHERQTHLHMPNQIYEQLEDDQQMSSNYQDNQI